MNSIYKSWLPNTLPFTPIRAVRWSATNQTPGGLSTANNLCCLAFHLIMSFLCRQCLASQKPSKKPLTQCKVLFSRSLHGTSCQFLMFLVGISLPKLFKANLIASLTAAVMLQGSWSQPEHGNSFELVQLYLSLTSSLLAEKSLIS